jgi:CBS domain-containing protein
MRVKELMTRDVEVTYTTSTLLEAADCMRALNVGTLPVCYGNRLVGMITDRDITVRAIADGWDPWTTRVVDVMTPEVFSCVEDQDVRDAAELMMAKQVRRLVVLDRRQRLVGILSWKDLAADLLPGPVGQAQPIRASS